VSPVQIELTAEQQDFLRRVIETGRVQQAEDVLQEALALWGERERRRDEILAAIDEAEASLGGGEDVEITLESMREFAEDVKRRGRARFLARHPTPR
jgi:Arc/MetJ-type ribon-helix-helix transcriptional regulator